jgi:hypothetical protein
VKQYRSIRNFASTKISFYTIETIWLNQKGVVMKKTVLSLIAIHTSVVLIISCKNNTSHEAMSNNADPGRCTVEDVGEAADFIVKKEVRDDRLVVAHGLANPTALIWRDDIAKKTFYLARVMGTERKLYFLKPVADDETPGVASVFEGHLLKWSHLDPKRRTLLMKALADNYNIKIQPDNTYIILQGEKPEGCP